MRAILLILALFLMSGMQARACAWHGFTTSETLVDRLIGSNQIVLARPDPADPFRYVAVEALEGDLRGVSIPFLVSSYERRRMEANPGDAVMFARAGQFVEWKRVGYIAARYRPLIDRIIARLPDWRDGKDPDRFTLFAAYHGADDPLIRSLALRQLDRAPYAVLRGLGLEVDLDATVAGMAVLSEAHLLPVRILLLGLSGDPRARKIIIDGLESAIDAQSSLAGAWATALIEIDGPGAPSDLARRYLPDAGAPAPVREALVAAFAAQGQGGAQAVRPAIGTAIADVLSKAPTLAPAVARQFGAVSDWSQRDALAAVLSRRVLSIADIIVVSQYISLADKARKQAAALGQ